MARTVAHMVPRPFFVTPLLVREMENPVMDCCDEVQFRYLFGSCGASLTAPNIVKAMERGLSAWCLLRWTLPDKPPPQDNPIMKDATRQDDAVYRKHYGARISYRRAQARIILNAFRKLARRYKQLGYKAALKLPGIGKAQLAFLGVKA